MLQMAHKAQNGSFILPTVMTLMPILLLADEMLIMSTAAIGLNNSLMPNYYSVTKLSRNTSYTNMVLGLYEKLWDFISIEQVTQR